MPATSQPWQRDDAFIAVPEIEVAPMTEEMDIDIEVGDLVEEALEEDEIATGQSFIHPDVQDLVERAAEDLASLDNKVAAREIHNFARAAMDVGRPGIFRDFLATYVDPNWKNLPDDLATLNIIAWMPDTGEFLDARIKAARYIGLNGELDTGNLEFLWKDLRARVERVGNLDLFTNLLSGMAETGYADLVTSSLDRYLSSDMEQVQVLTAIMLDSDVSLDATARETLTGRMAELIEGQPDMRYDPSDVALAYWLSDRKDSTRGIVDAQTDPVLRLRVRLRLLLSE
jgi:hypothetical protein